MCPLPVLVLILQFCVSFPAVSGDCYDDPSDNNRSYNNCDTCYQTLANALLNTGDNKYQLSNAFFPDDAVPPVEVRAVYMAETKCNPPSNTTNCSDIKQPFDDNTTSTWYWLAGEFYIYQPLQIFVFRSLFFSPPSWRQECVVLCLPEQCLNDSVTFDDFLKFLTQRLYIYATYLTVEPRGDGSYYNYMGTAVNGNHRMSIKDRPLKGGIGHEIIPAGYILPPVLTGVIIVFVLPIVLCVLICKKEKKVMNFIKNVEEDGTLQANLVAITLLGFCGTIYIFALDMRSIAVEKTHTLPSYFVPMGTLYRITIGCSSASLIFDVFGMIVLFVTYTLCDQVQDILRHIFITGSMTLCIGSSLLSLSYHFQDVLIAWTTTPFYGSKIALFYGIVIFVHFISFKFAYTLSTALVENHNMRKSCLVVISLIITTVTVTGTVVTVAIFVAVFPTNNFIEQSVTALTTIYNGAIVLFGGLLAYKLFFSSSFSITGVLEKAMNLLPPVQFSPVHVTNWNELTNEGKMVEVIKALIHKETLKSHHDHNDFYMELNKAAAQAINCQENLRNALTPCVTRTLTHTIKFTLTQAHMPAAFHADGVNIVFIDPLVNALSEAVTAAAGTSLRGTGQITSRIKIDTFKLTVALTSALIPALTDVVTVNIAHIQPNTPVIQGHDMLKESMKGILVEALICNPSSPTLNNARLKASIKSALIPVP